VVSHGEWRRLLACLLGYFLARMVVIQASGKLAALADPSRLRHRRELNF